MNSLFLWDLIKTFAVSLLIIFLIHHIWIFIDNNSTQKSTKALIENQTEKYKKMIDELTVFHKEQQLSPIEKQTMIDELNTMISS
jgi:hypothetical protein